MKPQNREDLTKTKRHPPPDLNLSKLIFDKSLLFDLIQHSAMHKECHWNLGVDIKWKNKHTAALYLSQSGDLKLKTVIVESSGRHFNFVSNFDEN